MCSLLAPLKEATAKLNVEQVTKCINMFGDVVNWIPKIFDLQLRFKKPADMSPLYAQFKVLLADVDNIARKDIKAPPQHTGIVNDAFQMFLFHSMEAEGSVDYMKELLDQLPFRGNKILKMDKENDTNWVNAFMAVCKAHNAFYKAHWEEAHTWKGSSDAGFAEACNGLLGGADSAKPAAKEEQKQAPPVAAADKPVAAKAAPVKKPKLPRFE